MLKKVKPDDLYPTKICKPCITKLGDFQDFYDSCKQANLEFQSEVNLSYNLIFTIVFILLFLGNIIHNFIQIN